MGIADILSDAHSEITERLDEYGDFRGRERIEKLLLEMDDVRDELDHPRERLGEPAATH